jgi:hypothetical protein
MGVWSGSVRVDLAVINGELCGFELKSDRDTLERLPFQADLYSRVFDRVELVVGSRHSDRAAEIVPRWWKITIATMKDGEVSLRPMAGHRGRKNPNPDPYLVAQLLWKDEAIAILDTHGLSKGFKSKPIKILHRRLAQELKFDLLSREVREALKRRPSNWLGQQVSNEFNVPVDAELNPMLKTSWTGAVCSNCVNVTVGPTVREGAAPDVLSDGGSMSNQLWSHIHTAESGSCDSTTNQEVCSQV